MIAWSQIPIKERKEEYKKISIGKSLEEKTELFKNIYKDLEGVCLSTGPSLLDFSKEKIIEFCQNKPVFTIKTATLKFANIADICITNTYNTFHFQEKRKYLVLARQEVPINQRNWINLDLIKKETYFENFFYHPDILWGSDISTRHSRSVCNANRWEENSLENNPINRIIGPGIMNDMVVPILIHSGLSKVSFLGWDGSELDSSGKIKHFYDIEKKYRPIMNYVSDDFNMNNLKSDLNEHEQEIGKKALKDMHNYFTKNNCKPEILTKNSSIDTCFFRNDILYS